MKKTCFITTVDSTQRAFVIPILYKLKEENVDCCIICRMSLEFDEEYSKIFKCVNISMERGANLINMIKSIWLIYKHLKNEKYDMFQYATPNAAFYASIAGLFAKIPKRIYCQWGIRYVGFSGIHRFLFKHIEKITCSLSTHIRPVSKKNMLYAIDEKLYKNNKAKVLRYGGTIGIDIKEFDISLKALYKEEILEKYPILKNKFIFGFIGRIERDKGVVELLRAFQRLDTVYSDVTLLIIGNKDIQNDISLEKELNSAKLNSNIVFTGFTKEIAKHVSVFDVHVHPSYREGFSMVIQQTMSMEIPVITTDIPGPSEVIEENITGMLVRPKDEISLFNMMCQLKNTPYESLREMGKNGRKRVVAKFIRKDMLDAIIADRLNILNNNQ